MTKIIPIVKLKANPTNPRVLRDEKFAKLKQSIQDFPDMLNKRPIVAVTDTDGKLMVLGGNMRLRACQDLGMKEVPVILADEWTEEQRREFIIKDNVGFGEWDWDQLANEWDAEDLSKWGMDLPADFGADLTQGLTDPDEVPETPETPITVLGDVWVMGKHRIVCGDSTEADTVAKCLNGVLPACIVTDPPYGIGIDGQKKSIAKNPKHNRKSHDFMGWDNERPSEACFAAIVGMGCPVAIFGGNYFADMLPASRGWIYWSKGQDGLTMSDGELAWTNADRPLRCVTVNRAALHGSIHPTQKPVEVIAFALEYLKPEGGPLFDPFLGSGTAVMVADKTNRACFGIERAPAYVDVAVKRWQDFTGEQAIHEASGKTFDELTEAQVIPLETRG